MICTATTTTTTGIGDRHGFAEGNRKRGCVGTPYSPTADALAAAAAVDGRWR